jgi:excinuclease ABC subunit C
MGEATVASCVVFDTDGPLKSDYRRFNIEGITPGDDYAAMQQALTRRFRRLKEGEGKAPDILFIDGGAGQLRQAEQVLEEMQVAGVTLVGVAKGPTRKPGLEQLILSGQERPLILPANSIALHLIQQIRDEAHRFAITGHRQRRAKARKTSLLEGIAGLGPKRRQQLLKQFGGLQEVARAGVEDLARVSGISRQLAQRIYDALHTEEG